VFCNEEMFYKYSKTAEHIISNNRRERTVSCGWPTMNLISDGLLFHHSPLGHSAVATWTSLCQPTFTNNYYIINKNALTENKPPPIRRIRISDFGLPDPKRDPDRQTDRQTDKQTDRQTDRTENITSFFGGGNYTYIVSECG